MREIRTDQAKSGSMKKILYVVGLILCFFTILIYIRSIKTGIYGMDEYRYIEIAKLIVRGDDLSQNFHIQKWPPGFPILLIIVNFFFNNYFLSAMIITAASATLFVLSTMLLVNQITQKIYVAMIIGIHTYLTIIPFAVRPFITDLPFAFCVQMTLYYLYKGFKSIYLEKETFLKEKPSHQTNNSFLTEFRTFLKSIVKKENRPFFLAGIFAGFSGLLRWTTMLLFAITVLIVLIFSFIFSPKIKTTSTFLLNLLKSPKIYCFYFSFLFIWSWWLIPNWIMFGSPFHNEVWWHPIIEGPVYQLEGNISIDQVNGLFDIIFIDLDLFLRNLIYVFGENITYFSEFSYMGPSLTYRYGNSIADNINRIAFGLIIIGIFSNLKVKNSTRNKEYPYIVQKNILWVIFFFMLGNSISHTYPRFIYAILPLGTLFLVQGIHAISTLILPRIKSELTRISCSKFKKYSKQFKGGAILLLFITFLGTSLNTSKYYWHSYNRENCHQIEMELIGEFFKEESNTTNICVSRTNYWYYINASVLIWDMAKLDGTGNVYYSQYFGVTDEWYPRTVAHLNNLSCDYLIYCELRETNFSPQLKFLLDPSDTRIPHNFEIVYTKTIIYESFKINEGKYLLEEGFTAHKDIVIYKIHH